MPTTKPSSTVRVPSPVPVTVVQVPELISHCQKVQVKEMEHFIEQSVQSTTEEWVVAPSGEATFLPRLGHSSNLAKKHVAFNI